MATPFVGEIRMFAGNFQPVGWLFCAGQDLPISEYETLFSLIGTTYGGDGQSTFKLPDLSSRFPIGTGGPSARVLGQTGGAEEVSLGIANLPPHTHAMLASTATGTQLSPENAVLASGSTISMYRPGTPSVALDATKVQANTGGGQPHENMHPFLAINFIISFFGIFPSAT